MRTRPSILLLAAALTALPAFAPAVSAIAPTADVAVPLPIVASSNVELLFTLPDAAGAFSSAFDPTRPLMYVNTGQGVSIYDTSDPAMPLLTGRLELPHFENEGMTLGQRADGTTFLLIGIDLAGYDIASQTLSTSGSSFYVADVTDPAAPFMASFLKVSTSTHTISCMSVACDIAWTSGVYGDGEFEVIDLSDITDPKVIGEATNINADSFAVHQWTVDDAGYAVGAGGGGTAVYDYSDPLNPVALNTTNQLAGESPYNDFLQHNADRPHGDRLVAATNADELAAQMALDFDVMNGNVMVITEEDYDNPNCQGTAGVGGAAEGGVSTWGIPYLSAEQHLIDNPDQNGLAGTIAPLDTWNSELYDSGIATPAGALCSAHYFDFHDDGFIAQGWYQQGTRILDMRDPADIKQVGYFIGQVSETWDAYWAPERDAEGRVTGNDTNILYTNDAARGVDVLRVTLPETAPAVTSALVAPILSQWYDAEAFATSTKTGDASLGYMCRLGSVAAIDL
jgi:hypothetical protein